MTADIFRKIDIEYRRLKEVGDEIIDAFEDTFGEPKGGYASYENDLNGIAIPAEQHPVLRRRAKDLVDVVKKMTRGLSQPKEKSRVPADDAEL